MKGLQMVPAIKGVTQNERLLLVEQSQEIMLGDVREIKDSLTSIQKELSARPSWATAKYLTGVTGMCMLMLGAILTYALSH